MLSLGTLVWRGNYPVSKLRLTDRFLIFKVSKVFTLHCYDEDNARSALPGTYMTLHSLGFSGKMKQLAYLE